LSSTVRGLKIEREFADEEDWVFLKEARRGQIRVGRQTVTMPERTCL
jgi:hypothetical protein